MLKIDFNRTHRQSVNQLSLQGTKHTLLTHAQTLKYFSLLITFHQSSKLHYSQRPPDWLKCAASAVSTCAPSGAISCMLFESQIATGDFTDRRRYARGENHGHDVRKALSTTAVGPTKASSHDRGYAAGVAES